MSWGEIGALLLVLVILFVVGRLWFHIVEGVLGGLKQLFSRRKAAPPWHPLPSEQENTDQGD